MKMEQNIFKYIENKSEQIYIKMRNIVEIGTQII